VTSSFGARMAQTSVVYDNKMWVIGGLGSGGYKNDVYYSTDGAAWTAATTSAAFTGRYGHSSVVYGNKMWVICGLDPGMLKNDVWESP
jgi:leucine-zipper-like transcriptional regulator 1